jgi:hypothetical protein
MTRDPLSDCRLLYNHEASVARGIEAKIKEVAVE